MREKSYVDYLLKNYHDIKREISGMERELQNFVPETEEETIEAMAFGEKNGEPSGGTDMVDKTGHIALLYKKVNTRVNGTAVLQIKKMIAPAKKEIERLERAIEGLEPMQKNIITDIYINKMTWEKICNSRYISQTSVWRLKNRALKELDIVFAFGEQLRANS